jgi:hypothetical protein
MKTHSVFLVRLAWLMLFWVAPLAGVNATDSATVQRLFRDPPREYSTGPLWVWNDMLTEDQIRDTLKDLAAQHVKQVWVHPRPGLMTPYLSADWFRLWRVALEEAERLDMNVWIYDENSYPSGFAGGWVPELMPESRGRGLALKEATAAPQWSDDIVAVYQLDGATVRNVTARVKAGEALEGGKFMVASQVRSGNSPWHGNRSYVNLLSPGVTEKFIEVTLEPYRREIGSHFGKRVPGVFTDEPNIRPAGGFPWSEVLAAEFQKRWHYDLMEHLPSLSAQVGDWRKVRHNYFQVLNEQFIERWARPNHDFCEANNLEWTGHYWDHDWPDCMGVPDNMAMYPWHQRPSIDCLMNQYSEHTHSQFGNVRMVKELSSIVNQFGIKRTLCEIYGAGGWDLRFEDMKRIGDWLEVLGVNTLNQHLSYVTIRGARKRDHPLSFSYHAPWWHAYHVSADYFARVSVALSQGEQINRVLVLQPTSTAWMYQNDKAKLAPLGESFFKLLMALEAAQVEYDIGCEDVMARHGSVSASGDPDVILDNFNTRVTTTPRPEIRVGARGYATVIIPPGTENLNESTVRLLDEFLRTGSGEVICMGEAPEYMDGAARHHLRALTNHVNWRRAGMEVVPTLAPKPSGSEGLAIRRAPGDKGILFHHRRHLKDGQLLFLVNTSIESPSSGVIESGLNGVEKWDLYTGGAEPYPHEPQTGRGLFAGFELPPSGSLLLFLSRNATPTEIPTTNTVKTINAIAGPQVRRMEPNVLTLDYVDITAGGETRTNIYFYQANQFAWKKNGMERNPWDSAVQFRDELISKSFSAESGFEASYRFVLENTIPGDLAIVIERPDLYTITCNDVPVIARAGAWWLDKAFGRIEIWPAVRTGENVVTIKAQPFTMFHELEPAYLLGSFGVKAVGNGFVITADTGLQLKKEGWNAQLHPFYSAGVSYEEQFDVAPGKGTYAVALEQWKGSVAEVFVNGKKAGFIDAPPWERDITGLVNNGVNRVEIRVFGTLKNLLGPHHGNPALGSAWPGGFQRGPSPGPPAGTNYSTVAYGLFEPFALKHRISVPQ